MGEDENTPMDEGMVPEEPAFTPEPTPAPTFDAAPPPPPPPPPAAPAAPAPAMAPAGEKTKTVAGILGILLGSFGAHKFYLGYTQEGIIMLAAWVLGWVTFGVVSSIISLIGLIEGIMYITKTDDEFYNTYVANKKAWF